MTDKNDKKRGMKNAKVSGSRPMDPLPHPEILEGYDYVIPGSAKTVLEMFKAEQKHRHEWENKALKIHAVSSVLGQVLAFFIIIAVLFSILMVALYSTNPYSTYMWVAGVATLVVGLVIWLYVRRLGSRALFAKPALRTHFRPEKETETEEGSTFLKQ